jgi:hypothetical protein
VDNSQLIMLQDKYHAFLQNPTADIGFDLFNQLTSVGLANEAIATLQALHQLDLSPISKSQLGLHFDRMAKYDLAESLLVDNLPFLSAQNDIYISQTGIMTSQYSQGKFFEAYGRLQNLREPNNESTKMDLLGHPNWYPSLRGKVLSRHDDLRGKSIGILNEGGFGDSFWFLRFYEQLESEGVYKIYWSPPEDLRSIFQCSYPLIDINYEQETPVDYFACLFTLFSRYQKNPYFPSHQHPYISLPSRLGNDDLQLNLNEGKLNLGFVWKSQSNAIHEPYRSMRLEDFVPLFSLDVIHPVSLQFGSLSEEESQLLRAHNIEHIGDQLTSFEDTGHVMKKLDLIISVDTAIIHLAGGLGLPVWNLLCFAPDYRWYNDLDYTPWYPTMRLFRQTSPGNWDTVMRRVVDNLRAM